MSDIKEVLGIQDLDWSLFWATEEFDWDLFIWTPEFYLVCIFLCFVSLLFVGSYLITDSDDDL